MTIAAFFACVAPAVAAKPTTLALKRLRLYETGVGYFERNGTVGAESVTLPVPASHLDDALKTLVVFSSGGPSELGGVEFGSSVSPGMARALAGLGPNEQQLGLLALLASLKGAEVELRVTGETVSGRLVEVQGSATSDLSECRKVAGPSGEEVPCSPETHAALVLVTRRGELRRFKVADVTSARPTDPAFAARIGAALDALSDTSARLMKEVRVLAQAGKELSLGYVSEAPVWRASYRLVLGAKTGDPAALQGWALIHNDTDEPWSNVAVELVNGRPDSFLFPLAAPRYARRALVTPENPLSTLPQLLRTTPDALWNNDAGESYGAAGLGLYGVGEGGGGTGEGIGLGSIGTLGHGAGSGDDPSSLLSVGNLAHVTTGEGVESGALFRYALARGLGLRAHGSALVPFVSVSANARRIALFDAPESAARNGVYLVHGGAQTLPPGTLSVFADGGFAGETALARLKPKEGTTLAFGADLDVTDEVRGATSEDEPKFLVYSDGGLVEHYVRHHVIPHRFENLSGSGRDIFLRLDFVNNSDARGADELIVDARTGTPYAVFRVGPRSNSERTLKVDEGLRRLHPLGKLTQKQLAKLAAAPTLSEAQRKILRDAITELRAADARLAKLAPRRAELASREQEVARLREHARGLGSAGESVVERLLAAEDKLESLRGEVRRLASESASYSRSAAKVLERLGT